MRLAVLACLLVLAPPLLAVKLKLKAEDKEAETQVLALNDDEVSYRRGRKDAIARIDDFEPASAFVIKRQFTPNEPRPTLELARFAMHRALYSAARDTARAAHKLDVALAAEADTVIRVADIIEAERMVDAGIAQIEAGKPVDARVTFTSVRQMFPATPSAIKAEVLLSTLEGVELELKARQLEEEARKAQDQADADERKKRQPVDDWLGAVQEQVKAAEDKKTEADADCAGARTHLGLPKYEANVNAMIKLRKNIDENRKMLKFRGQEGQADALDARAKRVIIECYERWAFYLYRLERYQMAADLCARGIALDPKDRRLLALKVDIDEMWDPTEKGG